MDKPLDPNESEHETHVMEEKETTLQTPEK